MKKLLLGVGIIVIMITATFFYLQKRGLQSFEGALKTKEEVKAFNHFIYAHDKEFVILSLKLDKIRQKEIVEGMKNSPNIAFTLPENNHTTYIIRSREAGRKEFIFKNGKLEGLFKTVVQKRGDGRETINLIAITPSEFKKKRK